MRVGSSLSHLGTLPQVTRVTEDSHGRQSESVVYQDLVAILTAMVQDVFKDLDALRPHVAAVEARTNQRRQWREIRKSMARSTIGARYPLATTPSVLAV